MREPSFTVLHEREREKMDAAGKERESGVGLRLSSGLLGC